MVDRTRAAGRLWSIAAATAVVGGLAGSPLLRAAEVLRSVGEILALPAAELPMERTALIRGVVTLARGNVVIEDDTGGIYVTGGGTGTEAGGNSRPVDLGDVVEIEGVVRPGEYAPNLSANRIAIVARGPLPDAPPGDSGRIFSGADTGKRVALRGVAQHILRRERSDTWPLVIEVDSRRLLVILPQECFPDRPDRLLDAEVKITGVVGSFRNQRGEFLAPILTVARPEDVFVEVPPSASTVETLPLAAIARFRSQPLRGHRLRTEGIVTFAVPGLVYLDEGESGVRVQLADGEAAESIEPGDRVEVMGFLDMHRRIGGLSGATVRRLGEGAPPRPIRVRARDLVSAAGPPRLGPAGSRDGQLVTCRGTVSGVLPSGDRTMLTLTDAATPLIAVLPGPAAAMDGWQPGAEVEVTGILEVDLASPGDGDHIALMPPAERLSILVRGPADVVVVRSPPWWTPRRLAMMLGGAAVVLVLSLLWVWLLRRQVRSQASLLASEIRSRHHAALEFTATLKERNRLAANLHDTLLQTLGGIGFQLDACQGSRERDESEAAMHFDVARRMVNHATTELHSSVWAMRSLPIRDQSFPEALRTLADRVAEGHAARVDVRTAGKLDDVPEFVAGHVLLIVQEALYNALRHGRPDVVDVRVHEDPATREIDVVIHDDGGGFDSGEHRGVDQGHFGIEGMRERAERLGGWLEIESSPGQGTTVHARVLRHEYDVEVGP